MTATSLPPSTSPLRVSIAGLLDSVKNPDARARAELQLAEGFFGRSDDAYIGCRDLVELLDQWRDLARWVHTRKQGEIRVRVFNPSRAENGYELDRTVLQTCMEDQPFIFDTLRLLLKTLEFHPLRSVHPILGVDRTASGEVASVQPRPDGAAGSLELRARSRAPGAAGSLQEVRARSSE